MLFLDALGALGLFLLGMWLMTEGLKLAGGQALAHILNSWTSSKLRSLISGVLITALVQSSSAVTVAIIGFVNAGLMTFSQSVWVVFGSNLGTTFTAWLVTLFGFNVKIGALIFPLVGVGAILRVFAPFERGRALGMALAGFGILFMGIEALGNSFSGYAENMAIDSLISGQGYLVAAGLAIGIILTTLTQSSSAAIAIILTATASRLSGIELAAAAIIGANIGTTSTALIATIGATANARRLAIAHVLFNCIAAILALLLLPLFLYLVANLAFAEQAGNLTLLLAAFHTIFNLLGIIAMIALEPWLTRQLTRLFRPRQISGQPTAVTHYIDSNIAQVPDLATRALTLELQQLYDQICRLSLLNIVYQPSDPVRQLSLADNLADINRFITATSRANLTQQQSSLFTAGLAATHYLDNTVATLATIREQSLTIQRMDYRLLENLHTWLERVDAFTDTLATKNRPPGEKPWLQLLQDYQTLKEQLIATAINSADLQGMSEALAIASLCRRYTEQLLQVEPYLQQLQQAADGDALKNREITPATN